MGGALSYDQDTVSKSIVKKWSGVYWSSKQYGLWKLFIDRNLGLPVSYNLGVITSQKSLTSTPKQTKTKNSGTMSDKKGNMSLTKFLAAVKAR